MAPNYKEIVEELNKHRAEVSKLKSALDGIDKEKELWFRKKGELSAKIRESIRKIKDSKAKRDSFTKEVKEFKLKRDSLNKDISSKSPELDKLRKERVEILKSLDVKGSPSSIKQQIEKLEFKIETDTVSFEKEKELMKKIKQLKKDYDKLINLQDSNKKVNQVLDIASTARREANEAHNSIQEKAKHSQLLHEEIIKVFGEINKLKKEEQDAFRKFSELKKRFHEASSELKEKLKLMDEVKSQLDKISIDKREKRKQEEESFLKSKEEAVNEKIRKKQKLTNEDLLVFQQKFGKG